MLEPKRKRQFGLRDKPDKRGDPFGALRLENPVHRLGRGTTGIVLFANGLK
jgi:23S rRNA-/tRNA-specific pseudouridylate synthase